MFTLTRREMTVVLYVLISAVIGLGVKRCREIEREKATPPAEEVVGGKPRARFPPSAGDPEPA